MKKELQKIHKLKVLVATLSNGVWTADFGVSLCNLAVAFHSHKVGEYKEQTLHIMHAKGSILPRMRYSCLKEAKKLNADYLLFVDSDQTFPRSALHRLISHDLDVVAANVAVKRLPSHPTATKLNEKGEIVPVFTDVDSKGLEEVYRVGTGLMLLSKKAIHALPPDCFEMRYRKDVDDYQGEDWLMNDFLAQAGFKTYIDHDLSKHVGHVGHFIYTHDWVGTDNLPEVSDGRES